MLSVIDPRLVVAVGLEGFLDEPPQLRFACWLCDPQRTKEQGLAGLLFGKGHMVFRNAICFEGRSPHTSDFLLLNQVFGHFAFHNVFFDLCPLNVFRTFTERESTRSERLASTDVSASFVDWSKNLSLHFTSRGTSAFIACRRTVSISLGFISSVR